MQISENDHNISTIYDNHGRPINYVRLAVTDRCNLRCFYCMPEEGIKYLPKQQLLSYEEMERLISLLAGMGVYKVRITGGEPFVRQDLILFMEHISRIPGIRQITMTTNGVLTHKYIPRLKAMGIHSVNLSMDTLDKNRFFEITRRNEFDQVMYSLESLIKHGIDTKINAVVMDGKNTQDIIPLAQLTKDQPIDVRFIEEMPFNGEGSHYPVLTWNFKRILEELKTVFPDITKIPDAPHSTAYHYQIPGHQGKIGIIAAFSRTFCGTCNRIRITAQGQLKTCLYDEGVLDIKQLMRSGASDDLIKTALLQAFGNRAKDGYEAEQRRSSDLPVSESMSTIGG
ncbi:MAG: GTP 3',8-cyclase MoaA [Microscillaceae bacterium]|nr:GTP 3',8-cyclase MoaA [Microscillaceae bacterium]